MQAEPPLAPAENAARIRRALPVHRARQRGQGIDEPIAATDVEIAFAVFLHQCAKCGTTRDLSIDHHHPLRDGYGLRDNAVPLCQRCNTRKGRRAPHEFYTPAEDLWVQIGLQLAAQLARAGRVR